VNAKLLKARGGVRGNPKIAMGFRGAAVEGTITSGQSGRRESGGKGLRGGRKKVVSGDREHGSHSFSNEGAWRSRNRRRMRKE